MEFWNRVGRKFPAFGKMWLGVKSILSDFKAILFVNRDMSYEEWKELEVDSEVHSQIFWRVAVCILCAMLLGMFFVFEVYSAPDAIVSNPVYALFRTRGFFHGIPISLAGGQFLGSLFGAALGFAWGRNWYKKYRAGKVKLRCESWTASDGR